MKNKPQEEEVSIMPTPRQQSRAKSPEATVPKPKAKKELTPEEVARYERAKTNIRQNEPGRLSPESFGTAGLEIVMDPKNPCLTMFRQLRHGQIDLQEFLLAIDSYVCQDEEILKGMEFVAMPLRPQDFMADEGRMKERIAKYAPDKAREIRDAFYAEARTGKYSSFFHASETTKLRNISSLAFAEDILTRQKQTKYGDRIRQIILTHERQGQLI